MLLGIGIRAGSGKDTVATHLVEKHGFAQLSFARKLKEVVADMYDIPVECFDDRELKNIPHAGLSKAAIRNLSRDAMLRKFDGHLRVLYPQFTEDQILLAKDKFDSIFMDLLPDECSPRRAAQLIGTEGFRCQILDSTWLDHAMREAANLDSAGIDVAFSDVRFPNEWRVVEKNGGMLMGLLRDAAESHAHSSEQYAEEYLRVCDIILDNNGTIQELLSMVDKLMAGAIGEYRDKRRAMTNPVIKKRVPAL